MTSRQPHIFNGLSSESAEPIGDSTPPTPAERDAGATCHAHRCQETVPAGTEAVAWRCDSVIEPVKASLIQLVRYQTGDFDRRYMIRVALHIAGLFVEARASIRTIVLTLDDWQFALYLNSVER